MLTSDKFDIISDRNTTREELGGICQKVLASVRNEKVLIKGITNTYDPLFEYFSYRIGESLGFDINKVELITCGEFFGLSKLCSVHYWKEDFVTWGHCNGESEDSSCWCCDTCDCNSKKEDVNVELTDDEEKELLEFRKNELRIFDFIIGNSDRHSFNWGIGSDKLPFIIDNGFASLDSKSTDWLSLEIIKTKRSGNIICKFLELTSEQIDNIISLPDEVSNLKPSYNSLVENIRKRLFKVQIYLAKKYHVKPKPKKPPEPVIEKQKTMIVHDEIMKVGDINLKSQFIFRKPVIGVKDDINIGFSMYEKKLRSINFDAKFDLNVESINKRLMEKLQKGTFGGAVL